MAQWRAATGVADVFHAGPACGRSCVDAARECAQARRLLDERPIHVAVAKVLQSTVAEPAAAQRLWWELDDVVRARRPPGLDAAKLIESVAGHGGDRFAERRGGQYGWTFATTDLIATAAIDLLLAMALGETLDVVAAAGGRFRAAYSSATERTFDPYSACGRICVDGSCSFRHAVADTVDDGSWDANWKDVDRDDAAGGRRAATWALCQDAAFELVEWPDPGQPATVGVEVAATARRVALCFAQQMVDRDDRSAPTREAGDRRPRAGRGGDRQ